MLFEGQITCTTTTTIPVTTHYSVQEQRRARMDFVFRKQWSPDVASPRKIMPL